MTQLYSAALEACLAAIVLIPILLLLNKIRFHSSKTTILYSLFTVYIAGVYAVVGLPNVSYIRLDLNLNLIPFSDMLPNLTGTVLNLVLFIPLGFFLPILWSRFRSLMHTLLCGFLLSLTIELLQIFTFRTTDVNDLITNTLGTLAGYGMGMLIGNLFPSLRCRGRISDLPILMGLTAAVMFFFQPVIWYLVY